MILLYALLAVSAAHADNVSDRAILVLGTQGYAGSYRGRGFEGLFTSEIEAWKLPGSQSTSRLHEGCGGILAETRLLGFRKRNYLFVGLMNHSHEAWKVGPDAFKVELSTGTQRLLDIPDVAQTVSHLPGERFIALVPFPDKTDLAGVDDMSVSVALTPAEGQKACVLQLPLQRDKSVPLDGAAFRRGNGFEMAVELGGSYVRLGGLAELDLSSFAIGVTFYGYPAFYHGFWLSMLADSLTSGGPLPGTASGSFGAGYAYRVPIGNSFRLGYDLGPAYHLYGVNRPGGESTFGDLSLLQKLHFDWHFASTRQTDADHHLGLSLFGLWIPSSEIRGLSASGATIGLLVRYNGGL